jgi:hypothetical protein
MDRDLKGSIFVPNLIPFQISDKQRPAWIPSKKEKRGKSLESPNFFQKTPHQIHTPSKSSLQTANI